MPYIVQKAMEYRGRMLWPGDPLGDDHPKRSLRILKRVLWVPSDGEPKDDPLAHSADKAISQPTKSKAAQPVEAVELPVASDAIDTVEVQGAILVHEDAEDVDIGNADVAPAQEPEPASGAAHQRQEPSQPKRKNRRGRRRR